MKQVGQEIESKSPQKIPKEEKKAVNRRVALREYLQAAGRDIAKKRMLRADISTEAFPEGQRPPYHQRLDRFIEYTNCEYFDQMMEIQALRIKGGITGKSLAPQPVICLFLKDERTGKEFCLLGTSGQPTPKPGRSVAEHTVELLKQVAEDLNRQQPGTYHVWELPGIDTDPSIEVSIEVDFGKRLRQLCSPKLFDHVPWSYPMVCGEPTAFILLPCLLSQYQIKFQGMAIYRLYDYRGVASIPNKFRTPEQKKMMEAYGDGEKEQEIRETEWGEEFCLRSMCQCCRSQREAWGKHQAYARQQLRYPITVDPYLQQVAEAYLPLVPTVVSLLEPSYPSQAYTDKRIEFLNYVADVESTQTKQGFDELYKQLFKDDFQAYEKFLLTRARNGHTILEDMFKLGRYEAVPAFSLHLLDVCIKAGKAESYLKIFFPFYQGDEQGWLVADRTFNNWDAVVLENYLELMWCLADPQARGVKLSLRAYKYFFSSSGPHRHRLLTRAMSLGNSAHVGVIFNQLDLLYEKRILTEQEYCEIVFSPDKHYNQSTALLDALGSDKEGVMEFFFKKVNQLIASSPLMEQAYLAQLALLPTKYQPRIALLASVDSSRFQKNKELFFSELKKLRQAGKITPAMEMAIVKTITSIGEEKNKPSKVAPLLRQQGEFKSKNTGFPRRDERTLPGERKERRDRAYQEEARGTLAFFCAEHNMEVYKSWRKENKHNPMSEDFVSRSSPITLKERIETAFKEKLISEERYHLWMERVTQPVKEIKTEQPAPKETGDETLTSIEQELERLEDQQLKDNFGVR